LPGTSGFDALLKIKQSVAAPVVIVSGNDSDSDVRRAIDLGAAGYIPKTHNQEEMILALKEVVTRGIYIPPNVRLHESDDPSIDLTDRQIEVLQCLLQGKSNKVIANVLSMAEGTVKAHLDAIYHKLHVNSRLQAMARAYALGLVNKFKRI
jgi:DNA-binding NarL/FixJ family response regulator